MGTEQPVDLSGLKPDSEIIGREPRNPCDVERTLNVLPEGQHETLMDLVTDKSLNASRLARQLRDRGIYLGDQTIRRHQNGSCARCHYHDRL